MNAVLIISEKWTWKIEKFYEINWDIKITRQWNTTRKIQRLTWETRPKLTGI